MKMNKIVLKKVRIEYLEAIVNTLEYEINTNQQALDRIKEQLANATEDFDIEYYTNNSEILEIKVQEGNKLLAELEKMV